MTSKYTYGTNSRRGGINKPDIMQAIVVDT
jgi:hypothetical protein